LPWDYPMATLLELVTEVGCAFLAAPPSCAARSVLRWCITHQLRAAILLPVWRDTNWWLLTEAAVATFIVHSAATLDQSPMIIYVYGFSPLD
jgi:hypothetical protein